MNPVCLVNFPYRVSQPEPLLPFLNLLCPVSRVRDALDLPLGRVRSIIPGDSTLGGIAVATKD